MNWSDAVDKVSQELGIPSEVVSLAYSSFWKFIKQTIQSLPLKEDISEREFAELRTNFNIPSLGKLALTWDRFRRCKWSFEYNKQKREKK